MQGQALAPIYFLSHGSGLATGPESTSQQIDKRLIVSLRMKVLSTTIAAIDDVVAVVPDYSPCRAWHTHTLANSSGRQEMENVPVSSSARWFSALLACSARHRCVRSRGRHNPRMLKRGHLPYASHDRSRARNVPTNFIPHLLPPLPLTIRKRYVGRV